MDQLECTQRAQWTIFFKKKKRSINAIDGESIFIHLSVDRFVRGQNEKKKKKKKKNVGLALKQTIYLVGRKWMKRGEVHKRASSYRLRPPPSPAKRTAGWMARGTKQSSWKSNEWATANSARGGRTRPMNENQVPLDIVRRNEKRLLSCLFVRSSLRRLGRRQVESACATSCRSAQRTHRDADNSFRFPHYSLSKSSSAI